MAQKKRQAEDLRVRRTRKALMQALLELTIEQGFAALTVQNIVDRAMVNRATFYRHYLDKYDLLAAYMREVYEMTAAQDKLRQEQATHVGGGNPPVGLVRMLEHVQQHAGFYRAMLGAKGDLAFLRGVEEYSEKRLRSVLGTIEPSRLPNGLPPDLFLSYMARAGVAGMVWWLNEGHAYSAEQAAAWLNQLTAATLTQMLGDEELAKR